MKMHSISDVFPLEFGKIIHTRETCSLHRLSASDSTALQKFAHLLFVRTRSLEIFVRFQALAPKVDLLPLYTLLPPQCNPSQLNRNVRAPELRCLNRSLAMCTECACCLSCFF